MGVAAFGRGRCPVAWVGPRPITAHALLQHGNAKQVYPMQRLDANRFHSTTDAVMVQKNGRGRVQPGGCEGGILNQPRHTPES